MQKAAYWQLKGRVLQCKTRPFTNKSKAPLLIRELQSHVPRQANRLHALCKPRSAPPHTHAWKQKGVHLHAPLIPKIRYHYKLYPA